MAEPEKDQELEPSAGRHSTTDDFVTLFEQLTGNSAAAEEIQELRRMLAQLGNTSADAAPRSSQ
jgi:hypothetical protein